MNTAVAVVELIFFILATLFMLYMCINTIITDIKIRKQRKQLDEAFGEFCNKISNAIIVECKKQDDEKVKKENIDYDKMSISELKKVAKNKKIKGYYNLHKKELIKAIKETV